jgi:beta-glucosidase
MDALVEAWLPGSEGEGVADLLFGRTSNTGKLPVTWPRTLAQEPINVGDRHYDPLYPYGYGLTTDGGHHHHHHHHGGHGR